MTVWDGDGNDTYDFSNYTTGVTVNLNPGAYSVTSATQTAYLGDGHYAHGSVYNAYLYDGDMRSYIENAVGGSGGDTLVGNDVSNRLDGGTGNDTLTGGADNDVFVFRSGYGADIITDYSVGFDILDVSGLTGYDDFASVMAVGAQVGANAVLSFSLSLSLTLQNVFLNTLTSADFSFTGLGDSGGTPNEAPTDIELASASVNENAAGLVIGGLTVTDTDDTTFNFDVSDARFEVTGTPGAYVLKLVNGVSLDYETEPSVNLTVTATDNGGLSFSEDFSILVNDVAGATVTGTEGRDTIDATRTVKGQLKPTTDDDIINAGAGNDSVWALGGSDVIDGGAGDDYLSGDAGNDRLTGGLGADRLFGGTDDDVFVMGGAEATSDTISGGTGIDTIEVTGVGALTLSRFSALAGSIEGWQGNGEGVIGTARNDILDFIGLQTVSGLAYVDGGAGNDTISGTIGVDDLRGGAGNDYLYGSSGNDRLTGGAGVDTLDGGGGDDTIVFGGTDATSDIMRGNAGFDTVEITGTASVTLSRFDTNALSIEAWQGNGEGVIGTARNDILDFTGLQTVSGLPYVDGGAGNDVIAGTTDVDDLRGGAGNDTLYGSSGDDRLTGGVGVDTLDGGADDDTFVFGGVDATSDIMRGDAGFDTVEITGTANVTLSRFDTSALSIEAWNGNGAGVTGGRGADILDFSALTSVSGLSFIDGGDGNDKVVGTSGADVLRGGTGNDALTGGFGDDMLTGGRGYDRFTFMSGFGHDIITDFEAGSRVGDVIAMDSTVFADLDSLLAGGAQVGGDVVFTAVSGDTLTLQNTLLTSLHTNDFAFV
jgi:Ca2+-binding RTX toxin-like protein